MARRKKTPRRKGGDQAFVTVYRHYRTGKLMDARRYGYKAWPLAYVKRKSA